MRTGLITLLAVSLLGAADEQQVALERKAKSAFDRAVLSAQPQLGETIDCVQAQAALLPVVPREEASVVYYRKGYCSLIAAAVSQNRAGFQNAATAFDQASVNWPARVKPVKGRPPEPAPSVLMVLSGIANLEAAGEQPPPEGTAGSTGSAAQHDIAVGVARNSCAPDLMTAAACQEVFRTGREWLGWLELRLGDIKEAARTLTGLPESFWTKWVAGKQAFADGRYADAAAAYGQAVELWRVNQARWLSNWMSRLAPRPQMGNALTDWGGARLLAGDPAAAISTLDSAVAADPQNPRAYYLRARAKEQAGQAEAASADYNLAVRTAFAGAEDLVSGEAHFYRGILFYRRKEFVRAEDDFASALNTDIARDLRNDAVAWRHMAAVASGACGDSRRLLAASLEWVSPYFPKGDARSAMASCSDTL